ncbi:MAG: non-canonical purine NTP pyrophosphatase, partial [Bryobacteraceae bacterium]
MTVYCATTNPGKLREFRLAAERYGQGRIRVEVLPGLDRIAPCEETGRTFEENAVQKALYYSAWAPGPLFAEDSGLEVDALGGAPGVLSARFA